MKIYEQDTIAAIATAIGGGIAVIRISGNNSFSIAKEIFRLGKSKTKIENIDSHMAKYGFIVNGENLIDEVILLPMKEPKTYTAEDVVEIHCHGGVKNTMLVLDTVLSKGARMAQPGEFTKRAFLNGRLDLSEAEAISDLINAKTDLAHKHALAQLSGNLSTKIKDIRNEILSVIAQIEANIDYPEDDVPEISISKIKQSTIEIKSQIEKLIDSAQSGKIIKEGIETVIIGSPNVGKSSLLNALLKEDRAIVTDVAGTTRDILQEFINIKGVPLKIVDTAGIRETKDVVEKIGVQLSIKYADKADLIMIVIDGSKKIDETDLQLLNQYKNKNLIVLLNKSDVNTIIQKTQITEIINTQNVINISAKNLDGIDELGQMLKKLFIKGELEQSNNSIIINLRHKQALDKAVACLENVLLAIKDGFTQEFISIDLQDCYNFVGEIIGETTSDDLLTRIFSEFCLGK